jgi:hypothetical protein
MQNNERSANGLLIAGALILAAIYILTGKHDHFTVTFTKNMLPKLLQDKMPCDAEAILVTATLVSKDCDTANFINSDKENAGIIYNKMINFFGRHDTGEMKERREN